MHVAGACIGVFAHIDTRSRYILAVSRFGRELILERLCCNKQSLNMQTNLIECLVWRYNGMAPGLIMFAAHTNTGAHTQNERASRSVGRSGGGRGWVQGDIPSGCPRST